jgi:hypothetical protein
MKKPADNKRSEHWPKVRKAFLAGKVCAVCGGKKKLEAHHMKPFHLVPELELDPTNLIALCEGNPDINCHLAIGHNFNFKGFNPDVIADSAAICKKKTDTHQALEDLKAALKKSS